MKKILLIIFLALIVGIATATTNLKVLGFKESSEYLPIPSASEPFPANQQNGLHISELEEDVFFVTDSAYTFCVVDIGKSLLVIDAPPTVGKERLINATKTIRKNKKVSHFIYTHAHQDHVGISNSFTNTKKIKYIAHELTAKLLKRDPKLPQPTILIKGNESKRKIGNKNFWFYYYGNSHAEGNLLIWLPKSKVIINIDIVFPQWSPFYGLGVTQDAIRYIKQYEIILSFPFKHFITGHLGRTATRDDLIVANNFIKDMKEIALEGLRTFNNITAYYAKFGGNNTAAVNHWAVLHNWEGDMASHCAETLINKYQSTMAGIDVYSWSNCWVMRENLALFYPLE